MRESIVCIGKIGTKPYCFPETGTQISSYEELCYYLSRHMVCYLYTLPEEDLLYYIRDELGLDKLYRQLSKLMNPEKDQMKYFSALFREGHYFSEEEIRQILDEYRSLKNTPYHLQCKWMGDLSVRSGRAATAIHYYREALKQGTRKEDEMGVLYHNMAVAKAKLFRFQDAGILFLKAYQHGGEEESLFYYYSIIAFTRGMEKAAEELKTFQVTDILLESFEERFAELDDDFACTEQAAKQKRITYLNENQKEEEALDLYHQYVRKLQKNFRTELEQNDNLPVRNLPSMINKEVNQVKYTATS